MMATTHAFVGLAMATLVALVAPEYAVPAAIGGLAGGTFPDLDLAAAHRRTLHFPVLYWLVALPAAAAALAWPGVLTVGLALFFLAAAVHSASDALGGGLETRPWEATSDRAVYLHVADRWVAPRRWIRYDGAPEDFAVGLVVALPGLLVFDESVAGGTVRTVVAAGLAVSLAYTVVRKKLIDVVPERYL